MNLQDVLQKRGEVVNKMTAMLNKAESEGRDLSGPELEVYNQMDAEQVSLKGQADRINNHDKIRKELEDVVDAGVKPVLDDQAKGGKFGAEYGSAFYNAMRVGKAVASPEVLNALQVGTDSEGGYITPESFETALEEKLLDINEIRMYASVLTTSSTENIPIEEDHGAANWTGEEAVYTESDSAFGRVILGAHKLGRIIKVSEELLQDSFFDLEGYLARAFGKSFGEAEETAFINGDGSGKPTGIVSGATAGVTAAAVAAITADELMDLFYSLKRPYRRNAVFIMNDATCKLVRKLKDSDGQYIWQPGLQAGEPDMLLGRPVISSTAMPTAATGNDSVVFGDLSYYKIADRRGTTMQRLNELYAANGQVGFRGYKRTEGKLTIGEAVKKLTQA